MAWWKARLAFVWESGHVFCKESFIYTGINYAVKKLPQIAAHRDSCVIAWDEFVSSFKYRGNQALASDLWETPSIQD